MLTYKELPEEYRKKLEDEFVALIRRGDRLPKDGETLEQAHAVNSALLFKKDSVAVTEQLEFYRGRGYNVEDVSVWYEDTARPYGDDHEMQLQLVKNLVG